MVEKKERRRKRKAKDLLCERRRCEPEFENLSGDCLA
jgi:hypothetical protein